MTAEQIIRIESKFPDGSKYITGFFIRNNAKPDRTTFGDKIGLWTWYAGNGKISKEIIYIR